ncbi:MAG: bifunctional folylpolyglutamate synthase/dihydrofolate synthase [Clostridia bacterium]|nr:bifunctional folylpolyglutamate synthase/dihydrofolate synthase [Clostridia bacterium]
MNYEEAVAYIHSLEAFGIRPGLERIAALCHALGDPQKRLKFVHVAGTNGKGSTSTMIAAALQAGGYTVGLYTSPYVIDFRERIRVNGEMIPRELLARCMDAVRLEIERLAAQGMQVTEFEAVTALAFLYYAVMKCQIVVLEVGLGGRFDATNVIDKPLVSVITSISLDHTAILGDSIEQIAAEKCGIIKPGGVTVCYPKQPPEALEVIRNTCREKGNLLVLPPVEFLKIERSDLTGSEFTYRHLPIRLPLAGEHMIYNCVTAIDALYNLRISGVCAFDDAIQAGIAGVTMPARTEVIRRDPLILLDGGHNEDCANALAATLRTQLAGRRIVAVCSLMADKDYDAFLQRVAPFADLLIATRAPVPRALDAQALADAAAPYCARCRAVEDPVDAVQAGFEALAGADDVLLVCGSFYLAGAVREKLKNL